MKRFHISRSLLVLALLALPSYIMPFNATAADAPATHLQARLDALAQRARPGNMGIAVLDLQSGKTWRVNADQAYPMMSVFKSPIAAAVLDRIEHGKNSFEQTVTITRADLGAGIIRNQFKGQQETFTVRELLTYAVSKSDNSAVDALIRVIGGPAVVQSYLHAHGIDGLHVDRDEAGNVRLFEALQAGETPPAHETDEQQEQRYLRGYHLFMADPGNRSTPDAAVLYLHKLWNRELLSPSSTAYLLNLMYGQTVPNRLRAGLPAGVRLADKCGTSDTVDGLTAAYNDIGIMTWPDGHTVIVAAFLSGSNASEDQRHALFVDLARTVAASLHP